jgi:hypothetical protein
MIDRGGTPFVDRMEEQGMSVAVGLVCRDGVVAAVSGRPVRGGAGVLDSAVGALSALPVVWASVGSIYVIEDVTTIFRQVDKLAQSEQLTIVHNFKEPRLDQVKQNLGTYIRDPMKKCYESALPGTQPVPTFEGMVHPFATDFLVLGYSSGTPWFIEVANDGRLVWRTGAGHYAAGAGGEAAPLARAILSMSSGGRVLGVEEAQAIAYRTVATTLELSAGISGAPVQIAVADASGARALDADQIAAVAAVVDRWTKAESETLPQVLAPESAGASLN